MEASTLTTVVLPLSLALIMMGMGLSLTPADFTRVVRYPRAVTVGLLGQLVLLPAVALALVWGLGVAPLLAVGLMIIAACPGGVTSNLFSHLARGDVALSVTLTAVASVITVFSIPLVVDAALLTFGQAAAGFVLPIGKTMVQVAMITVLPIALGMLLRHWAPGFARRAEGPVKLLSVLFLALLVVLIVRKEQAMIMANLWTLGPLVLALNVTTMVLGYVTARVARLDERQATSLVIEIGIQNGTLAIVIAASLLAQPALAVPAVLYSLLMFATAGVVVAWRQRSGRGALAAA